MGDRGTAEVPRSGYHTVREGDTLYRVAWQYGLDWRQLAERNRIREPYTIRPGQRIHLRGSAPAESATPSTTASAGNSGQSAAPARRPAAETTPSRRAAAQSGAPGWRWPLQGEVVRGFAAGGADMNKGLDIRAVSGTPLRVAAAGEVVYAGTGLRGYGQLVIVKHDDTWLSAYAHNSETLVSEGARVAENTQLAVLSGNSVRNRTVHFEIRRHGEPIDPTGVLPAR